MVKSAENGTAKNTASRFNGARYGRILLQRQMRSYLIAVIHVRLQHMTKMPVPIVNQMRAYW